MTPHVAGLTDVTYREICIRPAEAVSAILAGIAPDPRWVYSPPPTSPDDRQNDDGDHRDTASIQGALFSGRRCAEAVLGTRTTT